jgi:hypothetical protein
MRTIRAVGALIIAAGWGFLLWVVAPFLFFIGLGFVLYLLNG